MKTTSSPSEELHAKIEYLLDRIDSRHHSDWMRTDQALKYLSIDLSTLTSWTLKGIVPKYKICGTIYYNRKDIDELLIQSKH